MGSAGRESDCTGGIRAFRGDVWAWRPTGLPAWRSALPIRNLLS
jgi:hypothetical protein